MKHTLLFLLLFFLFSCATTAAKYESENVYKIFKNSEKKALDFRVKQDIKGNEWGELRSPFITPGIIKGQVNEDATGDIHFKFQSLKYLANWPNGWTEGESELTGELLLKKENERWKIEIIESYEIWELLKGEIRFMDEYLRDEKGQKEVKNRVDRINLVVDFLKENEFPEFFWHSKKESINCESFKNKTQYFLFPETIGINKLIKNNMLSGYSINDDLTDDIVINNGFLWRNSYTKKIFPENLHELRDSGSLWRDYEEALELFFMFYNMDYFFKNTLDGTVLKRVR